jgi:hypothetical protein
LAHLASLTRGIESIDEDRALIGVHQSVDHAGQRGLARTVGADDADPGFGERAGDVLEDPSFAEGMSDVIELDHGSIHSTIMATP